MMGGYANGRYPLSMMQQLGPEHYLPAGTAARWLWLVATCLAKYGVLLRITPGWNGYRPYDIQVEYRADLGIWAAVPGYSSHGLIYRGQQVAAIDVDNWAEVGWSRFKALCRLAGFTVDFVTPQELWHIGDFNDIWTPPAFTLTTPLVEGDTEMKLLYVTDNHDGNGRPGWVLLNTRTGNTVTMLNDGTPLAQSRADSWAAVWGTAKKVNRQSMLNAIAAIQQTA